MLSELPSFIKNFETQMTNLTAVETALTKNANKITKVRDNLTKAFNKKIKEKLEKISNQKVLLEDNEETVDVDLNSEEVNSSEMI
jgi:recombinational DNA repair ATPase RecF